jgi:SAM-dependent methyltransferase
MTHPSGKLLAATGQVSRAQREYQREYWATEGPRQYQQHVDRFEAMAAPFGQAMLDAARLQPGDRVLDVGCGHAITTIEAAERVAPTGRVVGVDISAAMLRPARQRVAAAGLNNIELLEADAQGHAFGAGSFDAVISRLGMMFFENPEAAFANLARALRPGGRLLFVSWQDPLKSEWIAVALAAAIPLLGRAPDLGTPGTAGPWAFADGDRLTRLITAGGFHDVRLETVTRPQRVGDDVDDAVGFVLSLPESQQLFAGAPEDTVAAAVAAVRAAFAPYAGPEGVVLDATAWLVSAHR